MFLYSCLVLIATTTFLIATTNAAVTCYHCFGNCSTVDANTPKIECDQGCKTVEQPSGINRMCGTTSSSTCVVNTVNGVQTKTCTCGTHFCNRHAPTDISSGGATPSPGLECYKCDNCATVSSNTEKMSGCTSCGTELERNTNVRRYCSSDAAKNECETKSQPGYSIKTCSCATKLCNDKTADELSFATALSSNGAQTLCIVAVVSVIFSNLFCL